MDAKELRLECLRLAHAGHLGKAGVYGSDVVDLAKLYHDFIVGEHKPVAQPRGADGRFAKAGGGSVSDARHAKTMADLADGGLRTGDPAFDAETDRLWDEHVARAVQPTSAEEKKAYANVQWRICEPPNPAPESESSFIRRCFGRF